MYELIILGGGPAGAAAGVYAARKKINTLLITPDFGGQSLVSADIQNWIGTKSLSGLELAKALEEHVRAQEGIEIKNEKAVKAEKTDEGFSVTTEGGNIYETKTVLIATGSYRRKLGVPGEKELDGRGVAYCATCDAPVFKNKTVAVVGGGNAGLEAVVDLFPYASKIYLLQRSDALKGDPITREKVEKSDKVTVLLNADTMEVLGEKMVTGLKYKDIVSGETKSLEVQGVFVEIGTVPNAELVKGLAQLNERGEIVVDHKTQQSSQEGVWAAGDVTDVLYKQNNISAGDAVKAVLDIYDYLNKNHR